MVPKSIDFALDLLFVVFFFKYVFMFTQKLGLDYPID